jgi:hypothetical protein
MKNIVMLANNVEYLKLFFSKLPKDFFSKFNLHLFVDTRMTKFEEIKKFKINDKIILYNGIDIMNFYKERYQINNDLLNKYFFSMRLMMIWYFFTVMMKYDFLMIDDDVLILNNNIEKIFEYGNFAMTDAYCRLNSEDSHKQQIFFNLCNIFELDINLLDYNKFNINTGICHIIDNSRINIYINRFFRNEFFNDEITRLKNNRDINDWKRSKIYFLDQYFVNFYFRKNGFKIYRNNEVKMRLLQCKFKYFNKKSLKVKPDIIHYCCTNNDKMLYVNWLNENI